MDDEWVELKLQWLANKPSYFTMDHANVWAEEERERRAVAEVLRAATALVDYWANPLATSNTSYRRDLNHAVANLKANRKAK